MESNGTPGRIHVSQATYDELVARGKLHWLVPREDRIEAKGKGLMQTYYILTDLGKGSRNSATSADAFSERNGNLTTSNEGSDDGSEQEDLHLEDQLTDYLTKTERKLSD